MNLMGALLMLEMLSLHENQEGSKQIQMMKNRNKPNPMIKCALTRENVSKEEMNYVQTNNNNGLEHYMVPITVLIVTFIIVSNVLLLIALFKTY